MEPTFHKCSRTSSKEARVQERGNDSKTPTLFLGAAVDTRSVLAAVQSKDKSNCFNSSVKDAWFLKIKEVWFYDKGAHIENEKYSNIDGFCKEDSQRRKSKEEAYGNSN